MACRNGGWDQLPLVVEHCEWVDSDQAGSVGAIAQSAGWEGGDCVAADAVVSVVLQFPPAAFAAGASSWFEIHATIHTLASCIVKMIIELRVMAYNKEHAKCLETFWGHMEEGLSKNIQRQVHPLQKSSA